MEGSGLLRCLESGVWSHSGVWRLESGVTPSRVWRLEFLRSLEAGAAPESGSGVWSYSGACKESGFTPEPTVWSLESLRLLDSLRCLVWSLESLRSLEAGLWSYPDIDGVWSH